MACGCHGHAKRGPYEIERLWRCKVHSMGVYRVPGRASWECRRCRGPLGPGQVYRIDGGRVPQTDAEAAALETQKK